MFPFTKVETSEKKVNELTPPLSDSMDRTEHSPITVGEVQVEINPIDYDSDDEEVSEINGLFEPKPSIVETISSLDVEKESKETSDFDVKAEITIEVKSFRSLVCNLLSRCFNRSKPAVSTGNPE
jgi:hypothetical protein